MNTPIRGTLTNAGTMRVGDEDDRTGLFIAMTVAELRAVPSIPMYRNVDVTLVESEPTKEPTAPAQVTEAHKALWNKLYNLAHDEIFDVASSDGPATQLIADSEARAVEPWRTQVEELRGALALGQQNCDDVFEDLREERDKLRAENVSLRAAQKSCEDCDALTCGEVERMRADLAKERARLDAVVVNCWLVHKGNENMFAVFSHVCGDYITPWLVTERAAIDFAMQEDAK